MLGLVTPVPYLAAVLLALAVGVGLCVGARRKPGRWTVVAARVIALVLVSDAISFVVSELAAGTWSPKSDLPFALCDAAVLVAAAACWWRKPRLFQALDDFHFSSMPYRGQLLSIRFAKSPRSCLGSWPSCG